jgi:pimeloyl-ACP methyl ester carboxylesterase
MIFNYKDVPVFFTDDGKGEVVLLLHGFLENSSMWKDIAPELAKNHRVVAIDLLGHGQTGCLGYIHSMELMAEVVEAVLNHLKIETYTVIGHSMGGYVALALAEKASKNIQGLCLMNSTAQPDSEERIANRDRAIAAVKQNHRAFVSMSVSNLFAPDNRELLAKEIEQTKQEALKTPLQGIIAALEGMKIRNDKTQFLKQATFKKLLILGKKDPVLDYQVLLCHAKEIGVEIIEFSDGHMSHIENKKELTYKLMHFIEK